MYKWFSLSIPALILLSSFSLASERTQCGPTDERILSEDPAVGRMLRTADGQGGCTGTMISDYCMVSAGHCNQYANYIEFNTPVSKDGKLVHPNADDIYLLDTIIDYRNAGPGNDWMVFRVKRHPRTGAIPGIAQGHYNPSFEVPAAPLDISITGYGKDRRPDRNFSQQYARGFLTAVEGSLLKHQIDTQGGNSGSAIIELGSQSVIGVHTHGGCSVSQDIGANMGTTLANSIEFKEAVKRCLSL